MLLVPESSAPAEAQVSVALNAVNAYRALANLAAVTENAALSTGAFHHSIYMVKNNTGAHDEVDGSTWWTADGDFAGNHGNTFVSWPASQFNDQMPVDFWVAGVFHQGHILDQRLLTVGYGSYTEAPHAPNIEAGATLNFGDSGYGAGNTKPIMFPGNNKVMPLTTFGGNEFPDPFTSCPGYAAPTGPAISVQIATTPAVTAASLKRNGTDLAFCRIDETNYTNPDAFSQSLGRLVMANSIDGSATRHMIALIPRNPLTDGTYTVSITSNGTVYAWTFFVGTPPVTWTLTVSKNGTGSGTVSSNSGGISCGANCSGTYTDGAGVTLTASPAAGSVFAGWSGACTGTALTCSLTMNADKSATATFNTAPPPPPQRTLTVSKNGTGSGTVSSNPAGISCGADCSEAYTDGTAVTLTANAAAGSVFAGWSGACTGTAATCSLTMNADKSATATFNPNPGPSNYTASAVASPTRVGPGGTVGITTTVFSPSASTIVVDVEVYDANRNQVFQWYWEDQQFAAGQTRTFSTSWQVPAGLANGAYSVQVGLFTQGWASQILWNDSAAQVTVAPVNPCAPRPRVRVATSPGAQPGLLQVSVTAGQGALRSIFLGAATNASITIPAGAGGRAGVNGSAGNTSLTLSDLPTTLTFTVSRVTAGRATTVPLILVDDCGSWPTFVGGGPGAF